MNEMPEWFAWFLVGCGLVILSASLLYLREYLRYRKVVRKMDRRGHGDKVSVATHLIKEMDESELRDLANRTGVGLPGGLSR